MNKTEIAKRLKFRADSLIGDMLAGDDDAAELRIRWLEVMAVSEILGVREVMKVEVTE